MSAPLTHRSLLPLLCALALAGCSFKTEWRDTSGKGRGAELAKADDQACRDETGYAALGKNPTSKELRAFGSRLTDCMHARGWTLVRAGAA